MRLFAVLTLLLATPTAVSAEESFTSASRAAYNLISENLAAPTCSRDKVPDVAREYLSEALNLVSASGLSDATGLTPLHYAALADDVPALERFVALGYSLEEPDIHDSTPLHSAALVGSERALRYLIAAGANPNASAGTGATPLIVATAENNLRLVSVLLAAGASATPRALDGSTALHHALPCRDPELIEAILRAGAPIDHRAKRIAKGLGVELPANVR